MREWHPYDSRRRELIERKVTRSYNVFIKATDENGKTIELMRTVSYPNRSASIYGCVSETIREFDAVLEVKRERPELKNVRATSSRHV